MIPARKADRFLLVALGLVGALLVAGATERPGEPAQTAAAASGAPGTGGQMRDVDEQLVRRLIQQGKLSDREAQHYRRLEPGRPGIGHGVRHRRRHGMGATR
ncbi:MAG: hypothetical protein HY744_24515 [Deltaproteobacteria bacterium]|nr:hypothetical protein [Deltaproteobacteria bacterium]